MKEELLFSPSLLRRGVRIYLLLITLFEISNFLGLLSFNTEFTWLGLLVTTLAIWGTLEATNYFHLQKNGTSIHGLVWLLVAIALSLDMSADLFRLYSAFPWWDRLLHLLNSGIACAVIFLLITSFWKRPIGISMKRWMAFSLLFAMLSTITFSVLYEIEEYMEDILFGTNRLGPGTDTADDLTLNFLGVLFASGILYFSRKDKHDNLPNFVTLKN